MKIFMHNENKPQIYKNKIKLRTRIAFVNFEP